MNRNKKIRVLSLQTRPCCRTYKINTALMEYTNDIEYILVLEHPQYDKKFEELGYTFSEPQFVYNRRSNIRDKARLIFLRDNRFKQLGEIAERHKAGRA